MNLTIYTVDAFTDQLFGGNPAAVTVLPDSRSDEWLQSFAQEMNLSETAYLEPRDDGSFGLRWFTPLVEVALCGHATVASAHTLWQTGMLRPDEVARFHTKSGLLTATKRGDWIELDFPATHVTEAPTPAGLLESLHATPVFIGRSKFDYLLEIPEEQLHLLAPDFAKLAKVEVRGVIVTSGSADATYDFQSRFFAPASGINEDPVTGSAHCALTPYWSAKLGKTTMLARQASKRIGIVKVELKGDRVLLSGQAVTVLTAQFTA
jgi:PhzF family phenazine biosynthesis protein